MSSAVDARNTDARNTDARNTDVWIHGDTSQALTGLDQAGAVPINRHSAR